MHIFDSETRTPVRLPLLRLLRATAGFVFCFSGLLGVSYVMFRLTVAAYFDDFRIYEAVDRQFVRAAFLSTLLPIGIQVARGRRRMALFLRRFGFDDASKALTYAITGTVGRRWRMVTLDDARVAPMGVGRSTSRTWNWGTAVFLALTATAVALFYGVTPGSDFGSEILTGMMDYGSKQGGKAGLLGVVAGAFIGAFAATLIVAVASLMFMFIAIAFGAALLTFYGGRQAIRRAERHRMLEVSDESAIEPLVTRLLGVARRILAPRFMVVKVSDDCWRRTVESLAKQAVVTIVDVSEPSEHLAWEIELLQRQARTTILAIGKRDCIERWVSDTSASQLIAKLKALLADEKVLVYSDTANRRDMRRFARSLSSSLDLLETTAA